MKLKIVDRIKNKITELAIPFFAALPTPEKETTPTKPEPNPEEKDVDLSDDYIKKFQENAIEYNPETKAKMVTYYEDFRNEPKEAYVLGIGGLRTKVEGKETLGNLPSKVKRNT